MRFDKSMNVKVDGSMRLHMIEAREVLPATWLTHVPNQVFIGFSMVSIRWAPNITAAANLKDKKHPFFLVLLKSGT